MPRTTRRQIPWWVYTPDGKAGHADEFAQGVQQHTYTVVTPWDTWRDFVADMLGYSEFDITAASGTGLRRWLPEQSGIYPGMVPVNIRLREVTHPPEEIGSPAGYHPAAGDQRHVGPGLRYPDEALAVADVTWRSVRYKALVPDGAINAGERELDRYVTRDRRYGIDALPLTNAQFEFLKNDDTPAAPAMLIAPPGAAGPVIKYPYMDLIYIWHEVPSQNGKVPTLLDTRLRTFPGTTNSSNFDGYPTGTLLCGVPEVTEETNVNRTAQYRIVLHFQYRKNRWNTKYGTIDPDDRAGPPKPGFYPVGVTGTGGTVRPYDSSNFYDLFKLVA